MITGTSLLLESPAQACRARLLAQAIHHLELALKFRAEGYHELAEHFAQRSSHASRFIRKIDNRQ